MTQARNDERRETPAGALRGIRVLDFGHYIPGPLLGMLLADQGADVIKVERPGGDPARPESAFATWNRGKRSIVLDLKSDPGREHARQLTRRADVLIENFRPGVAERLGIGYEELAGLNPRLIYCSLPGFGEGSPYRDQQGWEPIIGAATGLYSKVEMDTEPLFTPLPIASSFAAIVGAVAVTMALHDRDRCGLGQRVEALSTAPCLPLWAGTWSSFTNTNLPSSLLSPGTSWPASTSAPMGGGCSTTGCLSGLPGAFWKWPVTRNGLKRPCPTGVSQ
jgi:crotonobetainyl-CoA:carnitine CoA-transferase CaiB-like acyl-CoA transferase